MSELLISFCGRLITQEKKAEVRMSIALFMNITVESLSAAHCGLDPPLALNKKVIQKVLKDQPLNLANFNAAVFSCHKCDRWLFTQLHLLSGSEIPAEENSDQHYYLEKMTWMQMKQPKGSLNCINCREELGSFDASKKDYYGYSICTYKVHKKKVKQLQIDITHLCK